MTIEITSQDWYSRRYILLEMVKLLQHRELTAYTIQGETMIRNMNGYNIPIFLSSLHSISFNTKPHKLYRSVGQVPKTPWCNYNMKSDQRDQDKKNAQHTWDTTMTEYDFFLDLDGKTPKSSHKPALKIKELFDDYKLPYSVVFSGARGFHFWIPSELLFKRCADKVTASITIANNIKTVINDKKHIDMSIYTSRRVGKLPYSIDPTTNKIILPLTDEQFLDFSHLDLSPTHTLSTIHIQNRGMLFRQGDPLTTDTFYDEFTQSLFP